MTVASENIIPASQARSREKLERILVAASHLMNERDLEDIRVADIAGAAGVATGTVYQRFHDRENVLAAVIDRYAGEMLARVIARLDAAASSGPAAVIEALSGAMVSEYRQSRGLLKAATRFWRTGGEAGEVGAPIKNMAVQMGEHLLKVLAPHMPDFAASHPERTISQALQFMFGILMFEAATDAGPLRLDEPWIEKELVEMFRRYTGLQSDV